MSATRTSARFPDGASRRAPAVPASNVCLLAGPVVLVIMCDRHAPSMLSLVIAGGLGLLTGTDIEDRRLPRQTLRLTVIAAASALVLEGALRREWAPMDRAALAALIVAGITGTIWWLAPGSFAFGDVKVSVLAAGGAAAVSWAALAATFFFACIFGSLLGVATYLHRDRSRTARAVSLTIPFVPGLSVGFILAVSLW